MKRVRKQTTGFGFFQVPEVTKEIKRQRKPKDADPFIERHKGKTASQILKEFIKNRRDYVQRNYSETNQIVLDELRLYEDIVNRLHKHGIL